MNRLLSAALVLLCAALICLPLRVNSTFASEAEPYVYNEGADIPASYDLRDVDGKCLVSPVKSQGKYGTCWAFSVCSAMESNYLLDGGPLTDVSELALSYFTFNAVTDPLGGTEGDGAYVKEAAEGAYQFDFSDVGYNDAGAMYSLLTWTGPIPESSAPYENMEDARINGLDESLAYKDLPFHLQNTRYIPFSDTDAVKRAVMRYGALGVNYRDASREGEAMYDNQLVYIGTRLYYYNVETASYYKYEYSSGAAGHAIALIGWDDNYPKTNFMKEPQSDGAWLCKDNAGDDYANKGFFWISYEDYDFGVDSNRFAIAFDVESADNYDNNYQYDGGSDNAAIGVTWNKLYTANLFTAKGDETLEAVGISSMLYTSILYNIYVYVNPPLVMGSDDNPRLDLSGVSPSATAEGVTDYKGFFTVKLDSPVELKAGDTFSIVVRIRDNADSGYFGIYFDVDMNYDFSKNIYCASSSEPNQSFLTDELSNPMESLIDFGKRMNRPNYSSANFRIKAYTSNIEKTVTVLDIIAQRLTGSADDSEIMKLYDRILNQE